MNCSYFRELKKTAIRPASSMRLSSGLLIILLAWSCLPLLVGSSDGACDGVTCGHWWKEMLSSDSGNAWFKPWNNVMQAKFHELSAMVEAEEGKEESFRVLMVGDSTMKHQFGVLCSFLGENKGRRFNPEESQDRAPGCCIDTKEGGGRGLCFEYHWFRFLNPKGTAGWKVDALYFGSGLHLLHMQPSSPSFEDGKMDPLRVQEWINYERLLKGVVEAFRQKNGPDARIGFMTNHAVADELYTGDFATIRDAYRVGDGNSTIRAQCENEVQAAATANLADYSGKYYDWGGAPDISGYETNDLHEEGKEFSVDSYCEEGLMDRRGSLHLARRARTVMSELGVPIVDAADIVEGQTWASTISDGRHFRPMVPLEVIALLRLLTSPSPRPSVSLQIAEDESNLRSDDGGPHISVGCAGGTP